MRDHTTRRTLLTAVLGLGLANASFVAAQAEGLIDKATGGGLDVAFYNFQPYAYVDDTGALTGTDVEILRVVLERMGGGIADAGATEWGALIPGVKTGRFDVVAAGMFVTPKRCAEVMFSEPTFGIQNALLFLEGNPHNLSNYESVAANPELKLGAVSGARAGGLRQTGRNRRLEHPAVAGQRDRRGRPAGRAHPCLCGFGSRRSANRGRPARRRRLESGEPFTDVAGETYVSHGAFAFRKTDADFVAAFNEELSAFVGTPEHVAIMEEHGLTADELPVRSTADLCEG